MSWNQSICSLKNKLAWSGCGLVWQVWPVWICKVLVGLVWVWQVRRVMTWSDAFGCGEVRFGRCGAVRQVTQCSDGFGRGTLGFGRYGMEVIKHE